MDSIKLSEPAAELRAGNALRAAADVSVVMPLYNGARYVAEALQSIFAQTVAFREIIVIDDGSEDSSVEVIEKFRGVTLVRKAHSGIIDTLNCGLARVSGEFVAFLDADDRWAPRKTEIQLQALHSEPHLSMVFGYTRRFLMTPDGERALDVMPGALKGSGLFRFDAFRRVGGFEAGKAHFIDWFARTREAGLSFKTQPEIVHERRIHDANYGILQKDAQRKSYHAALKSMLDRRRQSLKLGS